MKTFSVCVYAVQRVSVTADGYDAKLVRILSSFMTPEDSKISHKNTKIHKITHTKYDTKLHIQINGKKPGTILNLDAHRN